jgi:hypothetical protein
MANFTGLLVRSGARLLSALGADCADRVSEGCIRFAPWEVSVANIQAK